MNLERMEIDLRMELKLRLLPILKKDSRSHPSIPPSSLCLRTPQLGWEDEWLSFPTTKLFSVCDAGGNYPRVRIISGKAGNGLTTLGRQILECWLTHGTTFEGLNKYKGVFIIESEDMLDDETLSLICSVLPDTSSRWGIDSLLGWIETSKLLLIVDNFDVRREMVDKVLSVLKEWVGTDVLVLTNAIHIPEISNFLDSLPASLYCQIGKLSGLTQIEILKDLQVELSNMGSNLFQNANVPSLIEKYESLFQSSGGLLHFCQFIRTSPDGKIPNTLSSFLWNSISENLTKVRDCYEISEYNLEEWVLSLGMISYQCLINKQVLQGRKFIPLVERSNYLFPQVPYTPFLLESLFPYHLNLYDEEQLFYIQHHKQQEILAAYYVLRKNLDGMPLKKMLKDIKSDDLCVVIAGLLAKFENEDEVFLNPFKNNENDKERKVLRVLRNLSAQSEFTEDLVCFLSRILKEMECKKYLTEMLLRDIVLSSHLHVHDEGIIAKPLEILLAHNYPSKVHLLVRCGRRPEQIYETLNLIKDKAVKLTLAEMNHLKWGKESRSDPLIRELFMGKSIELQDFIGSLTRETISELHLHDATKHLVCLRVKVSDGQAAKSLVETQYFLQCLMWLEIDFDFDIDQVLGIPLPPIRTPLIDLSFCLVQDTLIPKLCDFLYSLSSRFSGLHLQKSTVSPQGVTEMLKYFFRRDITLNADEKTISKYRRYRFPELASVDAKQKLTSDETERLLGYDDRHHYSDNEVRSSYNASNAEVHALQHFLPMMNVNYFVYCSPKYKVTKKATGDCVVERTLISNVFKIK